MKIKNIFEKAKIGFSDFTDNYLKGGMTSVITAIVSLVITFAVCLTVFFASVQGAEKVPVPDVIGESLTDALLKMQVRELYPKIQLKYSDFPGDKGTVLEQNPKAGAIVKAYRRVTLTVSRGIAIDFIEDYVGKNADEVRNSLGLLFSGADALVEVSPFVYVKDESVPGTIIAQYPEAGTSLSGKIKLQFVVSSGMETEKIEMPKLEGFDIDQLLSAMAEHKIVLDLDVKEDENAPAKGKIVDVEKTSDEIEAYTRVKAILEVKPRKEKDDMVQGIFSCKLTDYPFPVPYVLTAKDADGKTKVLISANHPGMNFTVPYNVKKNTTLVLSVMGVDKAKVIVE
ncbi:PASTA domain-containing protein [Treponema sp.]|uniref:PASTA domain-containing protein n=1 Tax=Treponema sp. TaxID=166 RepID=UPI00298E3996|nr:PASTA domain-containing protein [Treponema sp.]MCQ2241350.1 PASTA domain-containing protein [Treponema sp.]